MATSSTQKSKIQKWLDTLSEEDQLAVMWDIALIYNKSHAPTTAGKKVEHIISGRTTAPRKNVEVRILVLDICKMYDNSVTFDDIF